MTIRLDPCDACDRTGRTCPDCDGTGLVESEFGAVTEWVIAALMIGVVLLLLVACIRLAITIGS